MNTHMETKVVKFNRKKHKRDPWITYDILESVNHKNHLYRKMKNTGSELPLHDGRKQEFNCYKNNLRRIINQAQKLYFGTEFTKHKNKKTCHTVDNALHRK